ncbi:alpha/beta fold hydrolase [Actinoplanes sp. NPDC051494]|uniref:alpha/beta fold hydrolase n=1 Tax=Actinoplanes sp. NPDC051494 TaxID=3363907 RepID=UPI0037AA56CA
MPQTPVISDAAAFEERIAQNRAAWRDCRDTYGALVGAQYAERYPHRVRAMVLESAFDHSLDTRGFLRTQAWALQDSFDAFVAWCDGK